MLVELNDPTFYEGIKRKNEQRVVIKKLKPSKLLIKLNSQRFEEKFAFLIVLKTGKML
jgi:hypothetical protein